MSLSCCDLLEKLLTPEPEKRITLSRIMRHPWFVKDAPPGLLELNSRLLHQDRSKCALNPHQSLDKIYFVAAEHVGSDPVQVSCDCMNVDITGTLPRASTNLGSWFDASKAMDR